MVGNLRPKRASGCSSTQTARRASTSSSGGCREQLCVLRATLYTSNPLLLTAPAREGGRHEEVGGGGRRRRRSLLLPTSGCMPATLQRFNLDRFLPELIEVRSHAYELPGCVQVPAFSCSICNILCVYNCDGSIAQSYG